MNITSHSFTWPASLLRRVQLRVHSSSGADCKLPFATSSLLDTTWLWTCPNHPLPVMVPVPTLHSLSLSLTRPTVLDSSIGKPAAGVEIQLQSFKPAQAENAPDIFDPLAHGYVAFLSMRPVRPADFGRAGQPTTMAAALISSVTQSIPWHTVYTK
jgi:hypothetical protein